MFIPKPKGSKKDKTQQLLKFSLFCILATGLVVTIFYLSLEKDSSRGDTNCVSTFVHDGFCDDGMNTEECDYDGGDCCYPEIDKTSCLQCFCYETMSEHKESEAKCNNLKKGDGYCDGHNNNFACGFDDGDCCLNTVKKDFCYMEKCRCHSTGKIHISP